MAFHKTRQPVFFNPDFITKLLYLTCVPRPQGLKTHYLKLWIVAAIPLFYRDRHRIGRKIDAERGELILVTVNVRDNNVDQALKVLKKKMQREGLFREMKLRRDFEKPSEKKKREKAESVRRWRKMERKRRDRD